MHDSKGVETIVRNFAIDEWHLFLNEILHHTSPSELSYL